MRKTKVRIEYLGGLRSCGERERGGGSEGMNLLPLRPVWMQS